MKRWAILTVGLYLLVLSLLSLPVITLCCIEYTSRWQLTMSLQEIADGLFSGWGFYLWLGVFGLAQILLLLVPIDQTRRRLRPRRSVQVPLWTGTFLLGNLFLVGFFSVACAIFSDDAFMIIGGPAEWSKDLLTQIPYLALALGKIGLNPDIEMLAVLVLLGTLVMFWMLWGLIFFRYSREDNPSSITSRAMRWLLRGSILELLVAIPCHIIVRHRDDCCAPVVTSWGIATGFSIMLLAFGPGVYFLFARRFSELQPSKGRSA